MQLLIRHIVCFFFCLSILQDSSANVILHAFNWRYSEVSEKADEIGKLGYKMVLVSPPLKSSGEQWWARYQPQDYRVIENPLGDTCDFKQMVSALKQHNVVVYADIVLNHMANEASERDDLNYPGHRILEQYAANPAKYSSLTLFGDLNQNLFSALDFNPPNCINNYNSPYEVQNWRLCGAPPDTGLPDLVSNGWVIEQQQNYLRSLRDMGVKGFRIDAAKHMPLEHINQVVTPDIKHGMHIFGEIITSGGAGSSEYDRFLKPYLEGTDFAAYDFPLFSSLFNAFNVGGSMDLLVDPLAFGQALQPERAITFVTTHDIPNNQGFRYLIMDKTDEQLAYAYIMGSDSGVPLVYSDHDESGDHRWVDAYKSAPLKAMLEFHNANHGQPVKIIGSGDCFLLFTRGETDATGVVGINKCEHGQEYWINTEDHKFSWYQTYFDVLDPSDTFTVTSQWHRLYIPGRKAKMWMRQ
ncbi:alpha-amylase family protein [Endozoicomonas sp.]|uniref:alpha-amylase family protein n=1 Tax=Endozoicomonas sp. TaxID=1892382 RepID=UPI003839E884